MKDTISASFLYISNRGKGNYYGMDYYCGRIVIMVIIWVSGLGNSAIVNDSNCFSTYRDFNGNLVFISFTSNYLLSTELFGCNEYLEISRINWLRQIIHCDCLACYLIEPSAKNSALRSICILRRSEGYSKPDELYILRAAYKPYMPCSGGWQV